MMISVIRFRHVAAWFFMLCVSVAQAEVCSNVISRLPIVNCRPGECRWIKRSGWIRPDETAPGTRPFEAPQAVEIETDLNLEGRVTVRFKGETTGRLFSFTGDWQRVSRISTSLPGGERYRLQDLVFAAASGKKICKNQPDMKRLDGLYRTSSAGACVLDVQTGNPLHIVRNEAEHPVILLKNTSDRTLDWTGLIRLCDFLGHVKEVPIKTSVGAGERSMVDIPRSSLVNGVWLVVGEIHGADGSVAMPATRFAVVDEHGPPRRLPPGKFRMGINYHIGRYTPVCRAICNEALKACGAKLVRISLGDWRSVQVSVDPNDSDWSKSDQILAEMNEIGCDVNALCWSIPEFAVDPDVWERAKRENNWKVWATIPPRDTSALESHLESLARRYGNRIAYYEVGNEWDFFEFFPGTTEEAIRAFTAAARALHRGCADVCVIPCGWACADDSKMIRNKGIQERLLTECRGLYDVHAVHLHGRFSSFRRRVTESFLPLREKCGVTVPWYANETAVSINHAGEWGAAEDVWKKILFAWSYGSMDYIWYNLRATGWNPKDAEQGYGMLTPDFYPRATFAAFSSLSKLLSGHDRVRVVRSNDDKECYLFCGTRDGMAELVMVGWERASDRRAMRPVGVRTDARKAFAVDLMGNSCEVPVENGLCSWPFGRTPSALRLASATMAEPVEEDIDAPGTTQHVIKIPAGAPKDRPADITVDGAGYVNNYFEANPAMVHRLWRGPSDCSFKIWFDRIETNSLSVIVRVDDDRHLQHAASARQMSEGDCVRIDFKVNGQKGDWNFGFRRTDAGVSESCLWCQPRGYDAAAVLRKIRVDSSRGDCVTTYEIVLPAHDMGIDSDPFGGNVSVSVKVDDADEEDRDLWIGFDEWYKLERRAPYEM